MSETTCTCVMREVPTGDSLAACPQHKNLTMRLSDTRDAILLAADTAPSEGPWEVRVVPMSQALRPTWGVRHKDRLEELWFFAESQAIAVANALNRTAARQGVKG